MSRIKLECVHADTCLPDYWSGHHLPYVQIPVYRNMKLKDIKLAIVNELKWGYVSGNGEDAELLCADYIHNPEDIKRAEQLTRAAYAAVNRIKPNIKGQRTFFKDLEEETEDCDCMVYAYFVFVEID